VQPGKVSQTALGVAAMRAAHLAGPPPWVFEDRFAIDLTSDEFRALAQRGELAAAFEKLGLQRVQGQVLVRARWAEEALEAAMAGGASQYVILGAGLDSFVLRRPDLVARLHVFELDHPDTQRYKRAALWRLGFRDSNRVEFVEADFERETIGRALARSGFSRAAPAFFSWLGVVSYLTRDAILATLASLRERAAPGSEIALDYPIPAERLEPADRAVLELVGRTSARLGEPRRASHDPEALQRDVCALGFELVEDLAPDEVTRRYFVGRSDGLATAPHSRLARFRTA
jgi:methyltransferase (TIGR00027 family)